MPVELQVLIAVLAVLELRISVRSRFSRRGRLADRRSLPVVAVTVYGGVGGGFLLAARVHSAEVGDALRWPLFALGLVLMCAGIVIRQWAIVVLGRFFTIDVRVQAGQTVVERGPYRWVRHPAYTGLIMTFVGIGLALGNWASLALLAVVPTVGLVVRIRYEERVLAERLGEPYRRFAATRAHLLPGVW
jgi:protein-S-isoprenylcysteine O-methyltransferase Ste14